MAEFIYQMYQARKAHGDKVILDDVTLSFYPGAKIGVVGPNGMGKSTLLNVLAGIVKPTAGAVKVEGRALASLSRRETAQHIAYVAQQQRIPHLSVYDQVLLGRRPHLTWAL